MRSRGERHISPTKRGDLLVFKRGAHGSKGWHAWLETPGYHGVTTVNMFPCLRPANARM